MIPLLHDFRGERVLIFGGGAVGARKARRFGAEARVLVISPAFEAGPFDPTERRHPDATVELIRAAPGVEEVRSYVRRFEPSLVIAATDVREINDAAADAASAVGALLNRADTHGGRSPGSVVVPATVRDGPVMAAVATGGRAPALSKHLRERIEEVIAGAGGMAELLGPLRDQLQRGDMSPRARREAIRAVIADDAVWKHLGENTENARQRAEHVVTDGSEDTQ